MYYPGHCNTFGAICSLQDAPCKVQDETATKLQYWSTHFKFSCWSSKFSSLEHVLIFFKADKVEQVSGETQMISWKGRRVCQWLWPLWQEIARKILGINMVANLCVYIYYLMQEKQFWPSMKPWWMPCARSSNMRPLWSHHQPGVPLFSLGYLWMGFTETTILSIVFWTSGYIYYNYDIDEILRTWEAQYLWS